MRYALRSLWTSKAFSTVAILCLSFGIGLNTTIFSVVDGVLLKPFPYQDPDRLFVVEGVNDTLGVTQAALSYVEMRELAEGAKSFSTVAGTQGRSLTISDGGEPERYSGAAITANLFPQLGIAPILGQGFRADDDRPGGGGVVLLSHWVWTQRYKSDPGVVGRTILVNSRPTVIVGVMPEKFSFPQNQRLWIPLGPVANTTARDVRSVFVIGRLAAGASPEQAQAEVATIAGRAAAQFPDTNANWGAVVRTLRERFIPPDVTLVIWLMMSGVTLVLFIACSNVANLLLARATVRRREFSVRTALGAGRRRIVRQLLTESIVLAFAAVPLGIVLAQIGTRLIRSAMPPDSVPYYIQFAVDARSLLYTVAIAVGTAVLFGLLPALSASKGNLHEALKEGTRGNSGQRSMLRNTLVVVQVSLALVALVGAMLFVRTFQNMQTYDVGFDPAPLMTMRFYLSGVEYEAPQAKARRVQDIVERVERLPGVEAVFASNMIPIGGGGGGAGNVVIDGQPSERGREPFASFMGVTPDFVKTLGMRLLRGRDFTGAEGTTRTPVAVINDTMAKRFWPEGDPLGARFRYVNIPDAADWFTVIGVIPDIQHDEIDADDQQQPTAYVPYPYQETFNTGLTIRVAGPPAAITPAVRAEIRAADANLPIFSVQTLEELRRIGYWQYALFGWVFGAIGVVGLLLASVGVYGVLSYSVSQRVQEIGVRMALGADRQAVLRLIVRQGLILTGTGVAAGLVLAPIGTWVGRSLFYNVSPFDPATFGGVAVFLMFVAFVASYLPARRATRVDPVQALRGE